jgi:hypothetical protein
MAGGKIRDCIFPLKDAHQLPVAIVDPKADCAFERRKGEEQSNTPDGSSGVRGERGRRDRGWGMAIAGRARSLAKRQGENRAAFVFAKEVSPVQIREGLASLRIHKKIEIDPPLPSCWQ